MWLLIQTRGSVTWPNLGEGGIGMMHVLEDVFARHSEEELDLGKVSIQN